MAPLFNFCVSFHLRAGQLTCPPAYAATSTTKAKAHPGDRVELRWNGSKGEVEVVINGISQGVCFHNLSGCTVFPAVATYMSSRSARLTRVAILPSLPSSVGSSSGVLGDSFDAAQGEGLTFLNEFRTARSTSTSNCLAVCSKGFGRVKAQWVFVLDEDIFGNEMTCLGCVTKPIVSRAYTSATSIMLRAFTGKMHGPGKLSEKTVHFRAKDVVTCVWDGTAGTLAYRIGDVDHGVLVSGLEGKVVFPACQMYGVGRQVTLVSCGEEVQWSTIAPFDRLYSSAASSLAFSNTNHTIRSLTATRSMAVVGRGFGRTLAAWEFRIDEDCHANEMTAFGCTTVPPPSHSFDNDDMPLMYRAHNGQVYGRGKVACLVPRATIHAGDIVRCEWDGIAGNLHYVLNGVCQGAVFSGLSHITVYPAVCTYGAARQVTILSCDEIRALTPLAAGMKAALAGIPGFSAADSDKGEHLSFSDQYNTVTSCSTTHSMAVGVMGFGPTTKGVWSFLVAEDKLGDESIGLGAVCKPISSRSYNAEGTNFMYRCFNGALLGMGKASKSGPVVTRNDVVTISWDGSEGTLSFSINDINQGVCFSGLAGKTVFPAATFYDSGRAVCLTRCEEMVDWSTVPKFDIARSTSSGLEWRSEGHAVSSTEGGHKMAVVGKGFGRCRAIWSFRIDRDEVDNEMVALGATTLPADSHSYDHGDMPLAYRAFNGQIYGRGVACTSKKALAHVGDVVSLEYDGIDGTMSLVLNGVHHGVTHTGLTGLTLHPAAFMYGKGRSITLLRAEEVAVLTPNPTVLLARVPGWDESCSSGSALLSWDLDGHTAISLTTASAMAIGVRHFDRTCRGVWTLHLAKDELANQSTALGAVNTRYPQSMSYDNTKEVYMYRCFNGTLYGNMAGTGTHSAVAPGAMVRFLYDGPSDRLYVYINGACQDDGEPCFTGMQSPIWPAACFYGSDRQVTLTECESYPIPAALPRLDHARSSLTGLVFDDEARVVRSTGSDKVMAVIDRLITRGKVAVEFHIMEDEAKNESIALGVTELPTDFHYDNGTTARTLRCYNGTPILDAVVCAFLSRCAAYSSTCTPASASFGNSHAVCNVVAHRCC